jgi:hypothetical protein
MTAGMKTSTIKKLLRNRIDAWLDTVKDTAMVEMLKKDTIVSGGAIASALAGDKINDYDLYFKTYSTALAVARYYVDQFNTLNGTKVAPNGESCSPAVKEMDRVNSKGISEKRIIIYMKSAGVAGEAQDEYKYFESQSEASTEDFINSLKGDDEMKAAETVADEVKSKTLPKYRPVFMSENAVTLSDKVQLVIRFHGEPDEIHENYDYAHAMCYYTYGDDKLVCPAEALECILSKTLIYKGSLYPVASVFRLRKFIERGWRITAGQMLKILVQISELDLEDTKVLREQLLGVDQAYMHQLLRALENKEPGTRVDATYLARLIDEIFE